MFELINISSKNGNISVAGVDCSSLIVDSRNGSVEFLGVIAAEAGIDHSNSTVILDESDIEKLRVSCINSPMSVSRPVFKKFSGYVWSLETSNAMLNLALPAAPDLAYHLSAATTLGKVNVGLDGLDYLRCASGSVEAKSPNFDSSLKKARISLETSNAEIKISPQK